MTLSLRPILMIAALLTFLGVNSLFVVTQTQKALVLQFGELSRVHETPGLKFKLPFIQDAQLFDATLLNYNLPIIEVNAGDQKRLVVDMFVRYQISDVLRFYKRVASLATVEQRLGKIVPDIMQEVIGRVPLSEMLSPNRAKIMEEIRNKVRAASEDLGIYVSDVRIIRADLPSNNSAAIFTRMETERRQEAAQFRAEGEEQAKGISARAEKERTVILAEARKKAETSRGQGDAKAAEIYAGAFEQDPEFFAFYRSLMAYKQALKSDSTTLVLSPQGEFFKYFAPKNR